jgi:hypothetical protein
MSVESGLLALWAPDDETGDEFPDGAVGVVV